MLARMSCPHQAGVHAAGWDYACVCVYVCCGEALCGSADCHTWNEMKQQDRSHCCFVKPVL
ncbi:hypothetical protein E2C01_039662 [Portunus trituberculatus]|uniref:Uncharacterized protein n=1 Tax=Portunus trituberculatus TaxID=210409 RepID=A0A5B7FKE3_PORTR|nr:hypothetical protein [Portunus trituberculatus]